MYPMPKPKVTFLSLLLVVSVSSYSQGVSDSLISVMNSLQSEIKGMKKIKFSGYIQSQVQFADSSGIASFAGGNFAPNVDKRFMVRRGRLKAAYSGSSLNLFVLQIDVTQSGVGIKDAYARFTDPWVKAIHLTAGVFDRPFGFEIGYSSSSRETPERGRMSQTIFNGEREVGAMLTFQMPKDHPFSYFKMEAGLFNGSGPTAMDFDHQKDFIGRIRIDRTTTNEKIRYGMGVSYYNGGRRMATSFIYAAGADSLGLSTFVQEQDTNNYGKIAGKAHLGADLQLSFNWPLGLTTVRAEYIQGNMPGTSSTTANPSSQPSGDTYQRKFNGAYFYFIQKILKSRHEIVVKYDWYDPNTDVIGDDIGFAPQGSGNYKATSKTDIKYTTLGLGYNFHYDSNVKLVFYYDIVTNETSKYLGGYTKDLKDNVVTVRVQYKF